MKPFQFALRAMMFSVTVAAAGSAAIWALPPTVAMVALAFLSCAIATVLITVGVHRSGYARAFSIGALVPSGALVLCMSMFFAFLSVIPPTQFDEMHARLRWVCLGGWVFAILCGGISCRVVHLIKVSEEPSDE